MAENDLISMLIWLGELIVASWALSYGAEHLSLKYGAKFIGRTVLSIATTLPEIAIVAYAAVAGNYGVAIGAGLGSNLLMMTLGLSIMLIIATTRLSKAPLRGLDVSTFKLDKIFLFITAIVSAILFIDGYNYFDGFVFVGMFIAYFIMALHEMKVDKNKESLVSISNNELTRQNKNDYKDNEKKHPIKEEEAAATPTTSAAIASKSEADLMKVKGNFQDISKAHNRQLIKALLIFTAGIVGILIGAEPFIHSLEGVSVDIGISAIVLSVIISPIAGEMPEKLSLMILARKGAHGASIAISNVLGSKILNNTLLLAIAVFGAIYHGGFLSTIPANTLLSYQMILVTVVTIAALIPMLKREIGLRVGIMLLGLYIVSLIIQYFLPHQTHT
ncbi:MAG: sodium:calcium antiporter [Nitrososphaeraceae archaeon]